MSPTILAIKNTLITWPNLEQMALYRDGKSRTRHCQISQCTIWILDFRSMHGTIEEVNDKRFIQNKPQIGRKG